MRKLSCIFVTAIFASLPSLAFAAGAIDGGTQTRRRPPTPGRPTGPRCLDKPSPAPRPPFPRAGACRARDGGPCFDGGRYVDAAQLGSGPTILNLWGSYCAPCRDELPAFQRFATAAGGKVRVVGVVTKDCHAAAQSVIDDEAADVSDAGGPRPAVRDRG